MTKRPAGPVLLDEAAELTPARAGQAAAGAPCRAGERLEDFLA